MSDDPFRIPAADEDTPTVRKRRHVPWWFVVAVLMGGSMIVLQGHIRVQRLARERARAVRRDEAAREWQARRNTAEESPPARREDAGRASERSGDVPGEPN